VLIHKAEKWNEGGGCVMGGEMCFAEAVGGGSGNLR